MIEVPAYERDIVRVFALNGDSQGSGHAQSFLDRLEHSPEEIAAEAARLSAMLGAERIDPTYTETFAVKDVAEMGLRSYIETAMDVPGDRLAPDRAKLDALEGEVLIVLSRALGPGAQTLKPGPELSFIGAYAMTEAPLTGEVSAPPIDPMPASALEPNLSAGPEGGSRKTLWIAGLGLLVAVALVGLLGSGGN